MFSWSCLGFIFVSSVAFGLPLQDEAGPSENFFDFSTLKCSLPTNEIYERILEAKSNIKRNVFFLRTLNFNSNLQDHIWLLRKQLQNAEELLKKTVQKLKNIDSQTEEKAPKASSQVSGADHQLGFDWTETEDLENNNLVESQESMRRRGVSSLESRNKGDNVEVEKFEESSPWGGVLEEILESIQNFDEKLSDLPSLLTSKNSSAESSKAKFHSNLFLINSTLNVYGNGNNLSSSTAIPSGEVHNEEPSGEDFFESLNLDPFNTDEEKDVPDTVEGKAATSTSENEYEETYDDSFFDEFGYDYGFADTADTAIAALTSTTTPAPTTTSSSANRARAMATLAALLRSASVSTTTEKPTTSTARADPAMRQLMRLIRTSRQASSTTTSTTTSAPSTTTETASLLEPTTSTEATPSTSPISPVSIIIPPPPPNNLPAFLSPPKSSEEVSRSSEESNEIWSTYYHVPEVPYHRYQYESDPYRPVSGYY